MDKEEIEKEDKERLIEVLTEHKDYIFEFDDDNIKVEYILDYIRELEFQNTALKAEHNHNITRIKELEQKEFILDKVTEFIKDDVTAQDIKFEGSKIFHFIYKKSINITKEKIAEGINSYKDQIEDIIEGGTNNGK